MIYEANLTKVENGWMVRYRDGSHLYHTIVIEGDELKLITWLAQELECKVTIPEKID